MDDGHQNTGLRNSSLASSSACASLVAGLACCTPSSCFIADLLSAVLFGDAR